MYKTGSSKPYSRFVPHALRQRPCSKEFSRAPSLILAATFRPVSKTAKMQILNKDGNLYHRTHLQTGIGWGHIQVIVGSVWSLRPNLVWLAAWPQESTMVDLEIKQTIRICFQKLFNRDLQLKVNYDIFRFKVLQSWCQFGFYQTGLDSEPNKFLQPLLWVLMPISAERLGLRAKQAHAA